MPDHRKEPTDGELQGDARAIAHQLFGATIDELEDLHRQAYLRGDRDWLLRQARRDPDLFLAIAKRIGVEVPPPRLLPDAQIQQTHSVAPIAPPDVEEVQRAAPTPPRTGDKSRRNKLRNVDNPEWRKKMRDTDPDVARGVSRVVALGNLGYDAPTSDRQQRRWEEDWKSPAGRARADSDISDI